MARILAIGVATLDIINEVDSCPAEDEEIRALAQTLRRGGNASNTLVVLSQLGHQCEWAGVLADEPNAAIIRKDLEEHGIEMRYCRKIPVGTVPTSYITLSRATASRTIVHYRDLPEFDFASFANIPLQTFDWIHFEGRNVPETLAMMRLADERQPQCPVSLEVEKPRPGIETLLPWADLILTAGAFARHQGCTPEALLRDFAAQAQGAAIVCTLGSEGAVALDGEGRLWRSPAFAPPRLVDTLGAGDTFNAAMIDSLLKGTDFAQSLRAACRLAGIKCGQRGLNRLALSGVPGIDE